ncbi:phosphoenolpyruvate-dependent sugar phosphotransferase system protein, partial [Candidatus Arthromitus sp. SFB-3]
DIDKIKAAGYDTTVVIIVTNSDDYSEIRTITTGQADSSKNAIAVVR